MRFGKTMAEINRREFLGVAAVCACGACCSEIAFAAGEKPVDAGPLSQYDKDGAVDKLAKSDGVILTRKNGRLFAVAAICTHRKTVLNPVEGELRCPGHGARFSLDGLVIKGPA